MAKGTAPGLQIIVMKMSRTVWAIVAIGLAVFSGILIGLSAPSAITGATVDKAPLAWLAERVFAFTSYWIVTASVVYGLLLSTKLLSRFAHQPITFSLHKDLAAIGLGLAGIHGTLLMFDDKVPFTAWQVLIPFMSPYQPLWVAAGQLALYLLALVTISWSLKGKIGYKSWRSLHIVTFLAFVAASLHGFLVGSNSDEVWAIWIYAIATSMVAFLIVYRLYVSLNIFCDKRRARREEERRARIGLTS